MFSPSRAFSNRKFNKPMPLQRQRKSRKSVLETQNQNQKNQLQAPKSVFKNPQKSSKDTKNSKSNKKTVHPTVKIMEQENLVHDNVCDTTENVSFPASQFPPGLQSKDTLSKIQKSDSNNMSNLLSTSQESEKGSNLKLVDNICPSTDSTSPSELPNLLSGFQDDSDYDSDECEENENDDIPPPPVTVHPDFLNTDDDQFPLPDLEDDDSKPSLTDIQTSSMSQNVFPKLVKNPSWKMKTCSALETLIKLDPLSAQAREVYYSACMSLGIPKLANSCEFSVFKIPNQTLQSRFSVYSDLYSELCWTNVATLDTDESVNDIASHGFHVNPEQGRTLTSYISFQEDEPDADFVHQFLVSEVALGTSQFCTSDNEPWSIIYHSQQLPYNDSSRSSADLLSGKGPKSPSYRFRVFSSDQICPKYVVSFKYDIACQDSKDSSEPHVICDCCEVDTAVIHCKNDNVNLCGSCDASEHSTKITSRHTRISLSEKSRPIDTQMYLCRICNIPVNLEDKMTGHHSRGITATHPLISLNEAYSEAVKASTFVSSDPLFIQFQNSLTKLEGEISTARKCLTTNAETLKNEIESLCKFALAELAAEVSEKEKFISEREQEIGRFRNHFCHMTEYLKFQQNELDPIDFIRAWNQWNSHNAEIRHKQFSSIPATLDISTDMTVKGTINVYSAANKLVSEDSMTEEVDGTDDDNLDELTKQFHTMNTDQSETENLDNNSFQPNSENAKAKIQRTCSVLIDTTAPHSNESLRGIADSIAIQEKIEMLAKSHDDMSENSRKSTLTKAGTLVLSNTHVPSILELAIDMNAVHLDSNGKDSSKKSRKSKKKSFFSRLLRKRSISIGGTELLENTTQKHALKSWNRPPSARGTKKNSLVLINSVPKSASKESQIGNMEKKTNQSNYSSPILRKQLSMTPFEGSVNQNLDDVINLMNNKDSHWIDERPVLVSNPLLIENPISPKVNSPIAKRVFNHPESSDLLLKMARDDLESICGLKYTPTRSHNIDGKPNTIHSKERTTTMKMNPHLLPGTPRPKSRPPTSSQQQKQKGFSFSVPNSIYKNSIHRGRQSLNFSDFSSNSKGDIETEGRNTVSSKSLLKYAKAKHTQCKAKHISLKHRPFHASRIVSTTQGVVLYYHLPFSLWSPATHPQRSQPKPILIYSSWKHGKKLTSAFDNISSYCVGTMSRGPFIVLLRAESSILGAYVSSVNRITPETSLKTVTFDENSSVPFMFRTASTKSTYTHDDQPIERKKKPKIFSKNDLPERLKLQSKRKDFLFSISLDIRVDINGNYSKASVKPQQVKKHTRVSSLVSNSMRSTRLSPPVEIQRLWNMSPTEWSFGNGDIVINDEMKLFVDLGHVFGSSSTKLAFLNESKSKKVDSIEVYGFDLNW